MTDIIMRYVQNAEIKEFDLSEKEKIFVNGMKFSEPRSGAPAFVKGSLSIKIEEFETFMKLHQRNGWINIDLKVSKIKPDGTGGNAYAELNPWRPGFNNGPAQSSSNYQTNNQDTFQGGGSFEDDIPF